MMTLHLKLIRGRWWILGDPDAGPMGPYDTKGEAGDDQKGLERCEKHGHKPGYVTSDKRKGKLR